MLSPIKSSDQAESARNRRRGAGDRESPAAGRWRAWAWACVRLFLLLERRVGDCEEAQVVSPATVHGEWQAVAPRRSVLARWLHSVHPPCAAAATTHTRALPR
eukprot:COSAG01_NODE_47823_length_386_cov_2.519164_1_plen_102_part_01